MKSRAVVCFAGKGWEEVAKERTYLTENGKLDFPTRLM